MHFYPAGFCLLCFGMREVEFYAVDVGDGDRGGMGMGMGKGKGEGGKMC